MAAPLLVRVREQRALSPTPLTAADRLKLTSVDNECPHGHLPLDPDPDCECWTDGSRAAALLGQEPIIRPEPSWGMPQIPPLGADELRALIGVTLDQKETPDLMGVLQQKYTRAIAAIEFLESLDVSETGIKAEQGDAIAAKIVELCGGDHQQARTLFIDLDERPAEFDGFYATTGWHWKLRQARNDKRNRFFEVLTGQ